MCPPWFASLTEALRSFRRPADYELSDRNLVYAAAASLSSLAGNYRSSLLGDARFMKFDWSLSRRNLLSARINTSRYYGENNVYFDPASPVTPYALSENWTRKRRNRNGDDVADQHAHQPAHE